MAFTKYACGWFSALMITSMSMGGCAAEGAPDDATLGSGGTPDFGNAAGQNGQQPTAGSTASQAGTGGAKAVDVPKGSGGTQAQAGSGSANTGGKGGSGGTGTAGMSAGSGGAAAEEDPFAGLFPVDPGEDMNTPPPAAGMCADAVCFDVFDCYLFHPDLGDCGFTDCVDFICK